MKHQKGSASTIPYQLRPHKAIERNLFVAILRKLETINDINLGKYRYVGFGAPFLEDFKIMHLDCGIVDMHCIEYDKHAHSRQLFNNPYRFLKLYEYSSTSYVTSSDFKQDKNQIIWFDFASPKEFAQQLIDIELLCEKVGKLDILKFTFNSQVLSFVSSHHIKKCSPPDGARILKFLQNDPTLQNYVPENTSGNQIIENFASVVRAMGLRAIKRGLAKADSKYVFNHIASFNYADGQHMTTITGIIETKENFSKIAKQSGLAEWEFFQSENEDEFITGNEIAVPAMTISERIEIDKKIPAKSTKEIINNLSFLYGTTQDEHEKLIEGYCRYYKFLPYYSKVTY